MTKLYYTDPLTKLYYTDPLAAAYMAKRFGVKFANNNSAKPARMDIITTFSSMDNHLITIVDCCGIEVELNDNEKIYIHPDSLHIFEPKEGDKDEDGRVYDSKIEGWACLLDGAEEVAELVNCKTARRDNKPFHWPESEQ